MLAAVTVAYSAALVVNPRVLARPTGLVDADGSVPSAVALLTRSIGVRDALLAALVMLAPGGASRTLSAARVIADAGDAVIFGALLPDRRAARKVAGVAAGWAVLEAVAARFD